MSRHLIKFLRDNFKKQEFCAKCGQDNPNECEECPVSGFQCEEEKLPYVSALPVDNYA
jgi:hypothetical protein